MAERRTHDSSSAEKEEEENTGSASPPADFARLPVELRMQIIELACKPVPYSATDNDANTRPTLDINTTLSLLVASSSIYSLVLRVLYRSVRISRPSALASFLRALSRRPQLGALVRNSYVGPVDELPENWSPLTPEWGHTDHYTGQQHQTTYLLSTSLQHSDREAELLPHWGAWLQSWPCHGVFGAFPGSRTVFDALVAAQQSIDVSLLAENTAYHHGREIAPALCTVRVFEVQAALDLYLMALRRWEDKHGICSPPPDDDEFHPPLLVTGYPNSPSLANSPKEAIVVTRSELLQHLARPHSITDRFDSPLLFARSGIDLVMSGGNVWDRPRYIYGSGMRHASDWTDLFSPSGRGVDFSLPCTASIGSLLNQLRMVMASTSRLENLCLTGFLERAIWGSQTVANTLPRLRTLSVGPPSENWAAPVVLCEEMGQIKELRICGVELRADEAAGVVAQLPALTRLQWAPAQRALERYASKLDRVVHRLIGKDSTLATFDTFSASRQPGGRSDGSDLGGLQCKEDQDAKVSSSSVGPHDPPLIELHLNVDDVRRLLEGAPSKEVETAWLNGRSAAGQLRRLLLVQSNICFRTSRIDSITGLGAVGRMYEAARRWWDEYGDRA